MPLGFHSPCLAMIDAVRPHVGRRAIRFDMLKKPATVAMSQISRSLKPARRKAARSSSSTPRLGRQLYGKVQHRPLARREPGGAIIHTISSPSAGSPDNAAAPPRHGRRGNSSSGCRRRPRPRSSRARACSRPDGASIRSLYMATKACKLRIVEGIGLEHVGYEAELFLAFLEIGRPFPEKAARAAAQKR